MGKGAHKEGQVEDPPQALVAWHRVACAYEEHCCHLDVCLCRAGQAIHQIAPIAVPHKDHLLIILH